MLDTNRAHDLIIGLDRSDRKVDLHFIDTKTGETRSETLDSSPENLRSWLLQLRQRHANADRHCQQRPQRSMHRSLRAPHGICLVENQRASTSGHNAVAPGKSRMRAPMVTGAACTRTTPTAMNASARARVTRAALVSSAG